MSDQRTRTDEPVIDPGFVGRRRPDVVSLEIDGDVVIYDETQETTHLLNATAALVWSLIDGKVPLDRLATEIAEAYNSDEGAVLGDLVALTRELSALGLMERACPEEGDLGPGDAARSSSR